MLIQCTDHMGNTFKSVSGMCAHYGIPITTYQRRIAKGWKQEQALTKPPERGSSFRDHLGNVYSSMGELCSAYGILTDNFYHRTALGWNLQEILETPIEEHPGGSVLSFDGKIFPSVSAMCRFYRISRTTYITRISMGWSQREALQRPVTRKGEVPCEV